MFQTQQDEAAKGLKWVVFDAADVGPAGEHGFEGDACFETGQGSAQAEVDAVPKGDVSIGRAVNVKGVSVRELILVAIGGGDPGNDALASWQRLATQLYFL